PGGQPPKVDPRAGGKGAGAAGGKEADAPDVPIDHLLVRFVDCDVRPGYTYQYQIQVEMVNPNFGNWKDMANPAEATEGKYRFLRGEFIPLDKAVTVPEESFLYAADPVAYRQRVQDEYKGMTKLRDRLQAREDQAVVQAMAWLEQVRTDTSGQREPVGAWVVAEWPVGRGDYVGKRTFVPLPLWSSETNSYVLRELSAEKVVKGPNQPKGWLVDFPSRAVLVDHEGGRVRTRANGKGYDEEVTSELLIAYPDGRLLVRNAAADEKDANRKLIAETWEKWVQQVKKTQSSTPAGGPANPFERPGPGGKPGLGGPTGPGGGSGNN
ncbi:MAG: hypothetical protein K2X82_01135, partial [Gemmataceae bacterium]|nr:hypothetical protein [Gemmataceae bacterium]